MDFLKKIFPISFRFADSVVNLVIGILIYLVLGAVGGVIIGFLAGLPLLGIIFVLIGSLLDIYGLAGIVIEVLVFTKILK